ncbi:hypothetical protein LTR09_006151 [Extremus antarcticus]|uniref:GH16 domain-containing protein n=1 Tax=Extremus antarcticus TaxID=702011 RepID=A0AAJ0DMF3_9PEZI|nr:hypothetical protein LTR09_006151 [Extremus antarcticus]
MEERAATFAATTTWEFTGTTLPTGLAASDYHVGTSGAPLSHTFKSSNVVVADGALKLVVPGGQEGQSDISSAEVATTFKTLYGSIKVEAIMTEVGGVCNGLFFYQSDQQESDIEWISAKSSHSNTDSPSGQRELQYTNQATAAGGKATHFYGTAPADVTSAYHEYRIDWTSNSTEYYLDGVLQRTMTTNVASVASAFVLNNWVNGDPSWTLGPPTTDGVLQIRKVTLAYNP